MNKIDYGGPMALAICHRKPLTIDTTPPVLSNITNVSYDAEAEFINFTYTALYVQKTLYLSYDLNFKRGQKNGI